MSRDRNIGKQSTSSGAASDEGLGSSSSSSSPCSGASFSTSCVPSTVQIAWVHDFSANLGRRGFALASFLFLLARTVLIIAAALIVAVLVFASLATVLILLIRLLSQAQSDYRGNTAQTSMGTAADLPSLSPAAEPALLLAEANLAATALSKGSGLCEGTGAGHLRSVTLLVMNSRAFSIGDHTKPARFRDSEQVRAIQA